MPRDVVALFGQEAGDRLIRKHCRKAGLPVSALRSLLIEVIDKSSLQRRGALWEAFDEILNRLIEDESGVDNDHAS